MKSKIYDMVKNSVTQSRLRDILENLNIDKDLAIGLGSFGTGMAAGYGYGSSSKSDEHSRYLEKMLLKMMPEGKSLRRDFDES